MKNNIRTMLQGGLIGLANIIPGVSGGTLAMTLGIYEKLIDIISNFFKNIKDNIKFIVLLGFGMVIAIILGASLIEYTLTDFPLPTTMFFVGLILGGLPSAYQKTDLKKNIDNKVIVMTSLVITSLMLLAPEISGTNITSLTLTSAVQLFFVGVIAATTMVVPGISGSLVLMMIGFYEPILNLVSTLKDSETMVDSFITLIPFGLGVLVGILLIAKLIKHLLEKHKEKTYSAIFGIILGSILLILKPVFVEYHITGLGLIIGIVLSNIGAYIAIKLGD